MILIQPPIYTIPTELNMTQVNCISRWKNLLESDSNKLRLIALIEMVEMLNGLEPQNAKSVYGLLIDSDICHFIAEIQSYRNKSALALINKIVCHLSEVQTFFANDFFRFFKSYLRILAFLPKSKMESEENYHQNIFYTINIFVKR